MRKLKVDHDQLEARVRRPKGDEHSAYTLPELTQGESHPFTDRIMEADIPQGWKPLNLERMTSAALASLRQADAKSLSKFVDKFGRIVIQIYNPNPERLEVSPDTIQPHVGPLLGFAREKVETRGYVDLMTTFGQGKLSNSFTIMYLIIDANTSYFALIGRKMLNELRAIVSIPHLKIKFPSLTGEIVTVKADQK
ncbi:hypothetical protein JHK87_027537 [Glycine soja]|nr:hypothetical protein JHK87_027537 [Glycine soja]